MTTVFISDIHLAPEQPDLTKLFFHFIKSMHQENQDGQIRTIFILGDLFASWIGDDNFTPFHQRIRDKLLALTQSGVAVNFMVGNRDFLLGEAFAKACGGILIRDPSVISLYGRKTLLLHGDSLCLADKSHQIYRRFVHQAWIQKIYLSLALSWRRAIARRIMKISKQRSHQRLVDVCENEVKRLMQKHNVGLMIHGHTHMPSIQLMKMQTFPQQRIVLSDWGPQGNMLVCGEDGSMELRYFNS